MKLSLVILAIVATVAYAAAESAPGSATPVADLVLSRQDGEYVVHEPVLVRQKRFTCDLLSFGAKGYSGWNHAACAAKCTATRHRGGKCNGPNCKCGKKW